MNKLIQTTALMACLTVLTGCETTNSIPYKASTTNIIAIQRSLKPKNEKVSVGTISMAPGLSENLMCRLNGPVKVAPGKTLPQYIKDAMTEELFDAQAYDVNAPAAIDGEIEKISFSSVSPAFWDITMSVKTAASPGYTVSVHYQFDTSWSAYSACKNVADAFGPAVQELLHQVVTNPGFADLAK